MPAVRIAQGKDDFLLIIFTKNFYSLEIFEKVEDFG